MASTKSCTIGGMRARARDGNGNGPYWFATNYNSLGTSVDDSDGWGLINGTTFNIINPIISSTAGRNKYTVAIKITTPSLSNVTISSLTLTCRLFRHGSYTGTVYASLRTTSVSNGSDTIDTWRTYAIGNEAYIDGVVASATTPYEWTMTFSGNFSANTSYYLFLYTKSTDYIYGAYGNWDVCSNAYITYTQNVATYDISYKPGSYSKETSTYSQTKTENVSLTLRAASYTRDGYTQKGWSTSAAGTSKSYNLQATYTANAAITLYPYWEKKTYTVTYNKGSFGTGTNTTATKTYGTTLTLSNAIFSRTGYIQTGWSTDIDGSTLDYVTSGSYTTNAAITLYPYWEPNTYTLTINPNGGSMYNGSTKTSSSFTTTFAYETKTYMGNLFGDAEFMADNIPTRGGYTFNGFTFTTGSGQKNTSGYTFYFMGEYAAIAQITAATTNTYIFNGDAAQNVTATASWTGNTYYVQYNANGGSGTMANSTHTYGSNSALTANTFTKTGYSFTGWNTAADGSGTSYADKALVSSLTTTNKQIVNLYAQWGEASYSVVFDPQGGSSSSSLDTMLCNRNTNYTLPTVTPTKTNYAFLGWSTSSTATSASYAAGATINNLGAAGAIVTLYAVWKAKTFTIKYNSNNTQNLSISKSYTATNTNTFEALPSTWTKSGYTALGWGTDSTTVTYPFSANFAGDLGVANNGTLNLYCIWGIKQPWTLAVIKLQHNDLTYTI